MNWKSKGGQISISVLTASIGVIIALSGTIYAITVNGLKDTDRRIEAKTIEMEVEGQQTAIVLERIDGRLLRIEEKLGIPKIKE